MSISALNIISESLEKLGINYEFGEWTSEIVDHYYVGEYTEVPTLNEDGMQETSFILNGFSRGSWLDLEESKAKIEAHFGKVGGHTAIAEDKSAVAIFYSDSLIIPTGDAVLKRIQINLMIKEWKVK